MLKRLLCCLLWILLCETLSLQAQTPTTQGKEFWISYMRNGHRTSDNDRLTLIVSAKRDCNGTVTNPNSKWQMPFQVAANDVTIVTIPDAQGYNAQTEGVANTGLYVTSEDTISLYIGNEATNSYDAANVLPVAALGMDYTLQTNQSIGESTSHYGQNRASFLVVATQDSTEVEITPSILTQGNHPAGQPYTVNLNQGQVYHVMNQNQGSSYNHEGDFSGTRVVADKPVAVFNGNCLTCIPGGLSTGYDHVFEQAMPTDFWGRRFVVTCTNAPSYMNLGDDQVKVTALLDGTTVTRDGQPLCNLDAGESATFSMNLVNEPCTYLEANLPIAVYLYQHSHGNGSPAYGDPSMVWISPVEQTVYEVTFSTFQVQEVRNHYVNIVCPSENVADITLDGQNIALHFQSVPGSPEYSYARIEISHNVHTLRCDGGFIAHVYGIGDAEGYAYSVGSSAKLLKKQLYVNDVLSSEYPNGYSVCRQESVSFRVECNYEIDHVAWDFDDGNTGVGLQVAHAYDTPDDYTLQAVVFRAMDNGVEPFDTLTFDMHVKPDYDELLEVTTCAATYSLNGQDYPVPGSYEVQMETVFGCDSIVHLVLSSGDAYYHHEIQIACEEYEWFGETLTQSNHYEHLVELPGCDSLYVLDLTIGHLPEHPERYLASCGGVQWFEHWCDATHDYLHHFLTPEGCEYDSVLHFTMITIDTIRETDEACELKLWYGQLVHEGFNYHLSPGSGGCDTVHELFFTLLNKVYHTLDTVACDSFEWMGMSFDTPGNHHQTLQDEMGCEVYSLDLLLLQLPEIESIVGMGQVAVATSFWPGKYRYHIEDSTGLVGQTVVWELVDNPGWVLEPHGASCVVTATSMDNVVLRAYVTNEIGCLKESFFTIHCSGFDVEERPDESLKIYPNPASNELMVKGEEINGIAIYDMHGKKVAERSCEGEETVRMDLRGCPPGMYLLEVHTNKGNKTHLFSVIY